MCFAFFWGVFCCFGLLVGSSRGAAAAREGHRPPKMPKFCLGIILWTLAAGEWAPPKSPLPRSPPDGFVSFHQLAGPLSRHPRVGRSGGTVASSTIGTGLAASCRSAIRLQRHSTPGWKTTKHQVTSHRLVCERPLDAPVPKVDCHLPPPSIPAVPGAVGDFVVSVDRRKST